MALIFPHPSDPPCMAFEPEEGGSDAEEETQACGGCREAALVTFWCRKVRSWRIGIRSTSVSGLTYYKGLKESGGLKADQVKRLKDPPLQVDCGPHALDKLILRPRTEKG
jgi:hypothetical protein